MADALGKLRLMCRRVLRRPGTPRKIMSVTLGQVFQERGEAPGLVAIEGGGALSVLVGAAGLLTRPGPSRCLPWWMRTSPSSALLAGRYDVLRRADWSDALQPRTGPSTLAEAVLALPRA